MVVVGTGGRTEYDFGPPAANSELRDDSTFGVLALTLRSAGYDRQFVPAAGASFRDSGSGACHHAQAPPAAPSPAPSSPAPSADAPAPAPSATPGAATSSPPEQPEAPAAAPPPNASPLATVPRAPESVATPVVAAPRALVVGRPVPGSKLVVRMLGVPSWAALAHRWQRCRGAICRSIGGATASSLRVSSRDLGSRLRAVVLVGTGADRTTVASLALVVR